ncbi:MAG: hypothetical protein IPP40_08245 [bacterium]|nr:hypothetical protein [bacterium]
MTITTKAIQLTETRLKQLDPSDMLGKTLELDKQLQRGIEIADEFLLHNKLRPEPMLDWFGLGGSAVSGDLLQAFGLNRLRWMDAFSSAGTHVNLICHVSCAAIQATLLKLCKL